jgi:3-methylcrotonyl-CoA carboxylase alpha subunit
LSYTEGEQAVEALLRQSPSGLVLELDGQAWPLAGRLRSAQQPGLYDLSLGPWRCTAQVHTHGHHRAVFAPEGTRVMQRLDRMAQAGQAEAHAGGLRAPMPGKVSAYMATVGQAVVRGQAVAVMEAMKMEHTLVAPLDGVVEALLYTPGDQVAEGAELLKLAAA